MEDVVDATLVAVVAVVETMRVVDVELVVARVGSLAIVDEEERVGSTEGCRDDVVEVAVLGVVVDVAGLLAINTNDAVEETDNNDSGADVAGTKEVEGTELNASDTISVSWQSQRSS